MFSQNADIGRGSLDNNVKDVFDKLHNVTGNTLNINTYPNINASVFVLKTVNEKLQGKDSSVKIPEQSTTDVSITDSQKKIQLIQPHCPANNISNPL